MSIMSMAANLLQQQLGSSAPTDTIQSALGDLLPTSGSDLDLGALVSLFSNSGGLASLAASWLGDGDNMSLSPQNIMEVLGESKVGAFASALGLDSGAAASGLAGMIPALIDKSSAGGSLTSNVAGSVLSGLAGKLFGR